MTNKKGKSAKAPESERPVVEPDIQPTAATAPTMGDTGRYAYEGLDRTIHEKARLGILTSLAANPAGLLFGDLKDLCSLTDGNLNRHLQTLQEAGLVEVWKRFQMKRPQTLLRLTDVGRQRLLTYIEELERVVADAAAAARRDEQVISAGREPSIGNPRLLPGWTQG